MIKLFPGEKVILEERRHWYLLFIESLSLFLLAGVPLILFIIFFETHFLSNLKFSLLFLFFSSVWWFGLFILFFTVWTNYYLDVVIITNRRVIDIEQLTLFKREIAECFVEKVQDVTVEIKGFLATLLRFGDVHIQTAGTSREFIIRHIPYPEKIKQTIFRIHEELRRERLQKES